MPDQPGEIITVAAIHFEPRFGDKSWNVERLLDLTAQAAEAGAQLIVHTEMATAGYCWYGRDEIRPLVEPIPGPTTDRFIRIARRHGCYVVIALPEVNPATGIFYNSAALVGPNGLIGVYRKTHSFVSEPKWAKDGDLGLPVFDTPFGPVGILICADAVYPETARMLALQGARILCFPANWLEPSCPPALWTARAVENGCYLIAANRSGHERGVDFPGSSCVIGPHGDVLAISEREEEIVVADIALEGSTEIGMPHFTWSGRRPEFYDNLTLNTYLHNPIDFHGLYDASPLPEGRRSRVAVIQSRPLPGDPAGNLDRLRGDLSELGSVDLVVLPNYALTGAPTDANDAARLAEPAAPAWLAALSELAGTVGGYLATGYIERDGDELYATAILLGPDGLITRYRTAHPADSDRSWSRPGNSRPPLVDLPIGRVGLLLGSDLNYPETARSLAIDGCDLLIVPAAGGLPTPRSVGGQSMAGAPTTGASGPMPHFHLPRVRALENNCYLAFANLARPDGIGHSGIFGPGFGTDGQDISLDAASRGAVWRDIDTSDSNPKLPTNAVRAKELLRRRQTALFDLLQVPKSSDGVGLRHDQVIRPARKATYSND